MLGGNPFSSPQLKEFREQAVNEKGIAVMTYLLSFFYNNKSKSYTIPTDLPYNIPSLSKIKIFLEQQNKQKFNDDILLKEGEEYFYELFSQCQETLSKL